MKSIKQFSFALVLAVTAILSSCSSDSSGGSGSGGVGTLKAKVGGTNFTSIPQAAMALLATNGTFQNLAITGADATGKSLQLEVIAENIGVGTYAITDQSDTFATGNYSEVNVSNPPAAQLWGAPYDGGGNSGSIVITSMTATNVKGTFSFTALNLTTGSGTKAITEGTFNVDITTN